MENTMKTILKVEGMYCAGCAGSIERALGRVAGVRQVNVDRQQNRATVEHDDTVTSPALADLVNEIGFTATVAR